METSPHTEIATKQERDKSDTGVANALLMAAYAMTELNAEGSPAKRSPYDNTAGDYTTTLRASPKRKSTEFGTLTEDGTTDGVDSASTSFESTTGAFPEKKEHRDASPVTAGSSPLKTIKQRSSKRSRVGGREQSASSGKDSSSDIKNTTRQAKRSEKNDKDAKGKSQRSTQRNTLLSVEAQKEQEVVATPKTRSRSTKKIPEDVLTPVSARCIDFRRMGVKETKKGDSDASDESNADQMEIAA